MNLVITGKGIPDHALYISDSYFKRLHLNISDEKQGVRHSKKGHRTNHKANRPTARKGRRAVSRKARRG